MKKIIPYVISALLGLNLIGCSPPEPCKKYHKIDIIGDQIEEILKWDEREIVNRKGFMNFYRNYELLIDGKKTGIKTTHPIPAVDCYMPDIEVFDYNEDGLKDLKITHRYSQENNKKEGPKRI